MKRSVVIFIVGLLFSGSFVHAQKSADKIRWMSFNQLNDSLLLKPKKVFVNFTADWCIYCKEMERTTFKNPEVIRLLNESYYAVKMNIESKDRIIFGEQEFLNRRIKKVNPVHDLPLLLASQKNKPFSLPAFLFFDENFQAQSRYFQFLDEKALLVLLKSPHNK